MKSTLLFLPVLLGGFVLAGCNAAPATLTAEPTQMPAEQTSALPTLDAKTEFTIKMSDFAFSETMLTAKAGQTITINLINDGGFHDLVIDELNVKSKQLKTGESQELTIVIPMDAKGKTYDYYCSVGQHRANGMEGKLIVN